MDADAARHLPVRTEIPDLAQTSLVGRITRNAFPSEPIERALDSEAATVQDVRGGLLPRKPARCRRSRGKRTFPRRQRRCVRRPPSGRVRNLPGPSGNSWNGPEFLGPGLKTSQPSEKAWSCSEFSGAVLRISERPGNLWSRSEGFEVVPRASESFRRLRSRSEGFAVVPRASESFRELRSRSESFGVVPRASESFRELRSRSEGFAVGPRASESFRELRSRSEGFAVVSSRDRSIRSRPLPVRCLRGSPPRPTRRLRPGR